MITYQFTIIIEGDFIDFNRHPAAGLQQWREFRDQVMAHLKAESERNND